MVLCLDPWLTGIPYIYLINNYWIFGNENFVPSLHFCERYSNTMVAGEFVGASAILFGSSVDKKPRYSGTDYSGTI